MIFISCIKYQRVIVEGSLEVKLPTIWTDEKAEVRREEKESEKRRERVRRVRRERVRREEKESEERVRRKSQVGKKVEKSQITVFFQMICGSGWSKVSSLKRRVRSNLPT